MTKEKIAQIVRDQIKELQKKGSLPLFEVPEILVNYPPGREYGDFSTNIAFQIAKLKKENPSQTASFLADGIFQSSKDIFEKVEANKGFVNFFMSKSYLLKAIAGILRDKDKFCWFKFGKNKKVNIEFISANPTGPLTLGNGRGGFLGDVLANVMARAGYKATKEYYINNAGEQIRQLGQSVAEGGKAVYKGEYIEELKKRIKEKNSEEAGKKAAEIILEEIIKPSLVKMGIKFDVWFSEASLFKKKEVARVIAFLKRKKFAYTKDGVLWFRATRFGDDKDRVLIKSNGEPTYLASDIAYLKNKFERGFDKLIFIWGADHHGYINRMRAAAAVLGFKKEIDFIIVQLVRLFQRGREVRMSKRKGVYVTMTELCNMVGLDSARFFLLARTPESHLKFDIDLAKEKSEKNPVYYVQYVSARLNSILAKARRQTSSANPQIKTLSLLGHDKELNLIKELLKFQDVVLDTARDYQVQRLTQYAVELAGAFHQFYQECRVISRDKELTKARLFLLEAVKIILENTLAILGIFSPKRMQRTLKIN